MSKCVYSYALLFQVEKTIKKQKTTKKKTKTRRKNENFSMFKNGDIK